MFEKTTSDPEAVKNSRRIYQEAAKEMKGANEKEERLMILESWQAFEVMYKIYGTVNVLNIQTVKFLFLLNNVSPASKNIKKIKPYFNHGR